MSRDDSTSRLRLENAKCCRGDDRRLRILPAQPEHVSLIDHLRRRDSASLGFLSRGAILEKITLGHVWLASIGGRPVGCLIHGSPDRAEVRVFLLMVDPAYRGRGIARRLIANLLRRSLATGARGLSLRCREGLSANAFWHRAGFSLHDLEAGRQGALFVWVRPTKNAPTAKDFQFHSRWHPCPACGRLTCDTWTAGARRYRTCATCTERRTRL
jgi:GNAT superfamily N-acetyltransferase